MTHILVVDDEPGVIITLKTMLMAESHSVITATNGAEGLTALKEQLDRIELIITDIQMPEMDGLQFISHILELNDKLPIIAISGGGNKIATVDPLETLQDKISGVIRKPFTHDELFHVVDNAIANVLEG